MKKEYILPEMDICSIDEADILTVSLFNNQNDANPKGDVHIWIA